MCRYGNVQTIDTFSCLRILLSAHFHIFSLTHSLICTFPMRILILFLSILFAFTACMKDDDYTVSANDILVFSKDTVKFDTIISGLPTKTYSFAVYNHADKAIRIPRISLGKGGDSPFKVQADGSALQGGEATDFEIARKDSMIVYLMANVPESGNVNPADYKDELIFTTEAGVEQKVVLTASGQDVETLKALRIGRDTTLDSQMPYHVYDSLVVEKGATLTLAAGTRFLFHAKAELIVYGKLNIMGTVDAPVTLRGDRLDNMFQNQPYDRTPGLWEGVTIKEGSFDNNITYADIHSANHGIRIDSTDVTRRALTIENSVITTVTNHALDVRMANVFVGNCQITNAGGDCLHMRGGDVSLIHTTLGRFYVFTGGYGHALDFANYEGDARLPIEKLEVSNSIITGYQEDELMGDSSTVHKNTAFNYIFRNCLINTPRPTGLENHFVNCLWDVKNKDASNTEEQIIRDKNFAPAFNTDHLLFTFELDSKSKAIGTADATITKQFYPLDRLGRTRGDAPDMGCYQHQQKDTSEKEQ